MMTIAGLKKIKQVLITVILITTTILLCLGNLRFYLRFDFNLIFSLIVAPFIVVIKSKEQKSYRYGILAAVFIVLYPFLKIQSLFFLGFACLILFIVETRIGKLNNLPFFYLMIVSPVLIYLIEIGGFGIRIQLTKIAAWLLSLIAGETEAFGNIIWFNEKEYSVDPACMGLRSVSFGMLLSLVLIAFFEKRRKTYLSFLKISLIMLIVFVLIIFSNLFRIIGLVLFDAAPETLLHDLIGVFCLMLYFIIPGFFIIGVLHKKLAKPFRSESVSNKWFPVKIFTLLLILALGTLNIFRENFRNVVPENAQCSFEINDMSREALENGINKFTCEDFIVYVKPAGRIYGADHTPLICWKGGGYSIKNEKFMQIDSHRVYFSELHSEEGVLYMTWWYDNGEKITSRQFDWRISTIKDKEPFYLINVASHDLMYTVSMTEKLLSDSIIKTKKELVSQNLSETDNE